MLTVVEINDIFTDRNFLASFLYNINMFLQIIYRQHQVNFIYKLQEILQPYIWVSCNFSGPTSSNNKKNIKFV